MSVMEKKFKLIGDLAWLRKALLAEVAVVGWAGYACFGLWYDAYTGKLLVTGEPRSMDEFYKSCIFFAPLLIIFTIALLVGSRRCLVFITLYSDRIEFKSPFCKRQVKSYYCFPDLYRASYSWFGKHEYIILTNQRYSYEELTRANWIFGDEDTIKIRYTKKAHKILLEMLPKRQKSALIRCFGTLDEAESRKGKNI